MVDRIRVLYVADDPDDPAATAPRLERADERLSVTSVRTAAAARERLASSGFDCAVLAAQLPETDALARFDAVRDADPDVPVVLYADRDPGDVAGEALSRGVTDFVRVRDDSVQYDLLAARVANAAAGNRSQTETGPAEPAAQPPRVGGDADSVPDTPVVEEAGDLSGTAPPTDEATQLELVLDDLLGPSVVVRKGDGVVEACTAGFADSLGRDQADVVGDALDAVAADDLPEDLAGHPQAEPTDPTWRPVSFERDGEAVPMRYRTCPWLDPDGSPRGTLATFVDDAERATLAARNEFFETVLDTVPDAIYALDEDMHYMWVNQGMADLTGYDREEIVGAHKSMVNTNESVQSGRVKRQDLMDDDHDDLKVALHPHVTADGEQIPTEVRFRALPHEEEDDFWGTAGVIRDVRDRLERQRELERQNRRLDQFASVVSHDLRNPLSAAEGRVQLAKEACECGNVESDLESAQTELQRMDAIIDDVLSFAHQGSTVTETEPVELSTVVQAAFDAVGKEEGTLVVESGRTVEANEIRLRRLFENLVRNATEHVGPDATVRVGATQEGFYFEDDGPGIPEDRRNEVFDAGVTTAEDGTGFGLPIVKTIAETHGWRVSITEGRDGGARFEVEGVDPVDHGEADAVECAESGN